MNPALRTLLFDLLSRPSVTPEDAGCQTVVAERLAEAGFTIEFINSGGVTNLWATHGTGQPLVCLAGHTDVVPPGPLAAWNSDPFVPTERDGTVVARGAVDMKGSVAAMTMAAIDVARAGHSGTLAILLTSDEEGPAEQGTRHVLRVLAERGVRIDAALVGEPTSEHTAGDTVKIGRRGSAQGHLKIFGQQGHTAYPAHAENAAHGLADAILRLTQEPWGLGTADFSPATLHFTMAQADSGAGNVIPGVAEARFNVRFGTDWTTESLEAEIRHRLSGLKFELDLRPSALPFLTAPSQWLERLSSAVAAETGQLPTPSTGGGTSDARFFAMYGIPVPEIGPRSQTLHAENECLALIDLTKCHRIYTSIVKTWLSILSHS